MYVTSVTNCPTDSKFSQSRKSRLAAVNQRASESVLGALLVNSNEQMPLCIALHISVKYCLVCAKFIMSHTADRRTGKAVAMACIQATCKRTASSPFSHTSGWQLLIRTHLDKTGPKSFPVYWKAILKLWKLANCCFFSDWSKSAGCDWCCPQHRSTVFKWYLKSCTKWHLFIRVVKESA